MSFKFLAVFLIFFIFGCGISWHNTVIEKDMDGKIVQSKYRRTGLSVGDPETSRSWAAADREASYGQVTSYTPQKHNHGKIENQSLETVTVKIFKSGYLGKPYRGFEVKPGEIIKADLPNGEYRAYYSDGQKEFRGQIYVDPDKLVQTSKEDYGWSVLIRR